VEVSDNSVYQLGDTVLTAGHRVGKVEKAGGVPLLAWVLGTVLVILFGLSLVVQKEYPPSRTFVSQTLPAREP
jgi:hypothetical protein